MIIREILLLYVLLFSTNLSKSCFITNCPRGGKRIDSSMSGLLSKSQRWIHPRGRSVPGSMKSQWNADRWSRENKELTAADNQENLDEIPTSSHQDYPENRSDAIYTLIQKDRRANRNGDQTKKKTEKNLENSSSSRNSPTDLNEASWQQAKVIFQRTFKLIRTCRLCQVFGESDMCKGEVACCRNSNNDCTPYTSLSPSTDQICDTFVKSFICHKTDRGTKNNMA
ncbi:Uncharacterised protein r2_g2610 [Pycnogonum litorale]